MSRRLAALASAVCAGLFAAALASAQPRVLLLGPSRASGLLRRPGVQFPHGLHEDVPRQGCAACHHHGSDAKGYAGCGTCHAGAAATRNAFHRMCIGCHDAAALQGAAAVPRTCGECHGSGRP